MNILLLDDDSLSLHSLENALRINGFQVHAYLTPQPVPDALKAETFDVIVTDYHLPGQKGTAIIHHLRQNRITIPVIFISGDQSPDIQTLSMQAGAYAFFRKPLDIQDLIDGINAAV